MSYEKPFSLHQYNTIRKLVREEVFRAGNDVSDSRLVETLKENAELKAQNERQSAVLRDVARTVCEDPSEVECITELPLLIAGELDAMHNLSDENLRVQQALDQRNGEVADLRIDMANVVDELKAARKELMGAFPYLTLAGAVAALHSNLVTANHRASVAETALERERGTRTFPIADENRKALAVLVGRIAKLPAILSDTIIGGRTWVNAFNAVERLGWFKEYEAGCSEQAAHTGGMGETRYSALADAGRTLAKGVFKGSES